LLSGGPGVVPAKAVATKSETTRRPLLPAWARALRKKWTRQRCQMAQRTFTIAAFSPSWASEMASLTPRRPRRASLRRNSVKNGSASEGPMSRPSTSRRPSVAHGDDDGHRDDASVLARG
jgi:hypothetical protein